MARWPWIERRFSFDFPPTKFPDVLERLRGTPARIEELVHGVDAHVLTQRDGKGWSIQENIGHLLDVDPLWRQRFDQFLAGERELCPADMTNRRTHEANYNNYEICKLLSAFRNMRGKLITLLAPLPEPAWALSALHPRLGQPMRLVDLMFFAAEHDDYHLARISELKRALM